MAGNKKKGFLGNWIVRNLLIALAVVAVLVIGSMVFLNIVTQHNKIYIVPDFSNMTVEEAQLVAGQEGMRVEVSDSVFVKRMRKGAVRDQNPAPGAQVKEGRRILLTINAMNSKKVTMPDLVGLSMRQALAELQSRGLVLGKLVYEEDLATNNVLKQLMAGREIEAGTTIETDTVIDLVVGLNPDTEATTYVPSVVGKKYLTAVSAVQKQSLNIRDLRFDASVKTYEDSLNAVVYRQSPEAVVIVEPEGELRIEDMLSDNPPVADTVQVSVALGSSMSLYLTIDPDRIPAKK